jgi:hypothetical protein
MRVLSQDLLSTFERLIACHVVVLCSARNKRQIEMSSRKTGRRAVTLKLVYYVRLFIMHAVCKSKCELKKDNGRVTEAIVLVLFTKINVQKSKRAMHYICLSPLLPTKSLLQLKIVNRSFSANAHHNLTLNSMVFTLLPLHALNFWSTLNTLHRSLIGKNARYYFNS